MITEGIKDKQPFRKITFGVDVLKMSADQRAALSNFIKKFNGEKLKTDQKGVWHTFIPVDDVEEFVGVAKQFGPTPTEEVEAFSKFKPREKGLYDGQKITFYDYSVSESNPVLTTGFLKPGFINPNRSLLKWPNIDGPNEMWIDNDAVDAYGFYHRDLGDVVNKYTKVYFLADMKEATQEEQKELLRLIKKYKGISWKMGGRRASGGQEYALIPNDKFQAFYHEAEKFQPYEGEMEKDNIREEEEEMINEARKIVRKLMKDIFLK